MRRPRITIAGLLGIVAFVAVAIAALRLPTDAWDSGVLGVTLTVLLISVLLAIHRPDDCKTHWLGFALFGWSYLALSLVLPIEARLPTTKVLALAWEKMPRREIFWADDLALTNSRSYDVKPIAPTTFVAPSPANEWDVVYRPPGSSPNTSFKRLVFLPDDPAVNFIRIGHSLFAIVFAIIGGSLSRRLYSSGQPGRVEEPDVPRPSPTQSLDA